MPFAFLPHYLHEFLFEDFMEKEKRSLDRYLLSDEQIRKFFEQGRQLFLGYTQPPRLAPQSGDSQVA